MSEEAIVVSRHRQHTEIEIGAGQVIQCRMRHRRHRPLVGDRVTWERSADGTVLIDEVKTRTTTLSRVNARGRQELLAANITQLVVVIAPEPATDWLLLDRYLAAAELAGIKGRIVLNKVDLLEDIPATLDVYTHIGYDVIVTSALRQDGLAPLSEAMVGELSAMVGQSGVGKSSLINALAGDEIQDVGALSRKGKHGRHTTTASTLHHLPGGGELIDSPGVRRYSPYIERERDVEKGFKEFLPYLGQCRFDDCRHLAEPDCAVKAALKNGQIAEQRYDSYAKLYALVEELRHAREA